MRDWGIYTVSTFPASLYSFAKPLILVIAAHLPDRPRPDGDPSFSICSGGAPQGGLSCPYGAIHLLNPPGIKVFANPLRHCEPVRTLVWQSVLL